MHPKLFSIGKLTLHSYGLMLAISFIIAIWITVLRARKRGINPDDMMDLSLWIMIFAIIGSRAFYILYHIPEYIKAPQRIFIIWEGGLVLLGGFIFSSLATIVFCWRKKIALWVIADSVAPSIGLAEFITRIGCFLNGCCFGRPTNMSWGMIFPNGSSTGVYSAAGEYCHSIAMHGSNAPIHIHPTQLYMAAYGLIIFLTLIYIERFKKFHGFLFFMLIILMSIARIIVDFFRYYDENIIFLGLRQNQHISVVLIIIAIASMIYLSKHRRVIDFPTKPFVPKETK